MNAPFVQPGDSAHVVHTSRTKAGYCAVFYDAIIDLAQASGVCASGYHASCILIPAVFNGGIPVYFADDATGIRIAEWLAVIVGSSRLLVLIDHRCPGRNRRLIDNVPYQQGRSLVVVAQDAAHMNACGDPAELRMALGGPIAADDQSAA